MIAIFRYAAIPMDAFIFIFCDYLNLMPRFLQAVITFLVTWFRRIVCLAFLYTRFPTGMILAEFTLTFINVK